MIIQIRGTSGSGKTYVMRKVREGLGAPEPRFVPGRKKPECYRYLGSVYVLGHYESTCGGCDNIGSARAVYELTKKLIDGPERAKVVIQEGLLLSEDTKWSQQLSNLRVVFLTTPLDTCLEQVTQRRIAAGNDKPLNPANTTNRVAVIERARRKLLELGIECRRCSSNQAPGIILNWIKRAT